MRPTPGLGHVDQSTGYSEVDGSMHQIKPKRHQKAGAGVFHVEFHTQRRSSVAHYGLGDSVDSDRIVAQHVLRQADEGSGKQTRNRIATRHGKKNRNQQGQVDVNRETRKPQRHKSLHKERQQGNADRYRDAEPVDLNLLPRCVGYGHAIVDYSRRQAAGNWPAAAWMAWPVSAARSVDWSGKGPVPLPSSGRRHHPLPSARWTATPLAGLTAPPAKGCEQCWCQMDSCRTSQPLWQATRRLRLWRWWLAWPNLPTPAASPRFRLAASFRTWVALPQRSRHCSLEQLRRGSHRALGCWGREAKSGAWAVNVAPGCPKLAFERHPLRWPAVPVSPPAPSLLPAG